MDKPTMLQTPPKKLNIADLKADICVGDWFHVLSQELAGAVKKAAIAGMPYPLAEQVYKEALGTVLPKAIEVRER